MKRPSETEQAIQTNRNLPDSLLDFLRRSPLKGVMLDIERSVEPVRESIV